MVPDIETALITISLSDYSAEQHEEQEEYEKIMSVANKLVGSVYSSSQQLVASISKIPKHLHRLASMMQYLFLETFPGKGKN